MTESIGNRVAKGAVWMVGFKLSERTLGMINTIILVRLLHPHDFGLVAMAMSAVALVELVFAFGFESAIIRHPNPSREYYDTVWTCNVAFGLCTAAVIFLTAGPLSAYYGEDDLVYIAYALGLLPLLSALQNVGIVDFRKHFQFRKEFFFQVIRKLAAIAVVIPLAFALRNAWALVAGVLVSGLVSIALSYLMHPFRPRLSLAERGSLFSFSKWVLLANVVDFFRHRTSDFVLGRSAGASDLGIFNVSLELASTPTSELSAPINRALQPGYAKLAERASELLEIYRNALSMLCLIAVPAAAGIYATADLLVPVVLGRGWAGAVPLVEILAFHGALLTLHSSIAILLLGAGHPRAMFIADLFFVAVMLPLLVALVLPFGAVGVAGALLLASTVATPVYILIARRVLGVPFGAYGSALLRPAIGATAMVFAVDAMVVHGVQANGTERQLVWLVSAVAVGVLVYAVAIVSMWLVAGRPDGPESQLVRKCGVLLACLRARARYFSER